MLTGKVALVTGASRGIGKEGLMKMIPMQRLGQPSDIANMVLFLAGNQSDYITGQVFSVDGGMAI